MTWPAACPHCRSVRWQIASSVSGWKYETLDQSTARPTILEEDFELETTDFYKAVCDSCGEEASGDLLQDIIDLYAEALAS